MNFDCSNRKSDVICQSELIYVFRPILFGRRMNPDIRNRFITYVTFTENDDPYIPKEGINVYLIRFVHQDPDVDGR